MPKQPGPAIADSRFVAEVEQMFEDDFRHSQLVEEGVLGEKPWWVRFGARFARLTVPLQ